MNKKYHIITIGCQMNKSDSERIGSYLENLGYVWSSNKSLADLVVITTCGVRQSAEDRVYGLIPAIKKENKSVKIILTGCLSERPDVKERLTNQVDIWLPVRDLSNLAGILSEEEKVGIFNDEITDYLCVLPKYNSNFSAFVPIGNGCDNFCTYCVVPYARGREKYRAFQEVIVEVSSLVKKGYKEITLIAQNVNSYRFDDKDFPALLRAVNDITGDFWIRFSTSHPKDMSDDLIMAVSECEKVCRHIHLPAQSGDNGVLSAMNRKYDVAHYLGLIEKIKTEIPGVSITTDIIVGFPGETKEQFGNTKKLFEIVGYDMAYIAQYSPRPGTAAAKMDDNISAEEKKSREEELMAILRRTALENNRKYIGEKVEVLVEGKKKDGLFFGKTGAGKVVKFKGDFSKPGEFATILIEQAEDFGLFGKKL